MFVCYSAAFCQLCFYNKDWIGLADAFKCSVISGAIYRLDAAELLSYSSEHKVYSYLSTGDFTRPVFG